MITLGNNPETYILVFIIFCILFVAGLVTARGVRKAREQVAKIEAELLDESSDEPTLEEIHAQILLKQCGVSVYGTKFPECKSEFFITFITDDGTELTYPVSETTYLELEEKQKGTLAIVNNNFYGFYLDEYELE